MGNLDAICARIQALPLSGDRRLIAIVGAPASGKSTFAKRLSAQVPRSCVVPMDGFHRDNQDLERLGLMARKGAPETFDVTGFSQVLEAIKTQPSVPYPTFDRANDCVVPQGGTVAAHHQTVLVEGNYLLLKTGPWGALCRFWDMSILLDVPHIVLRDRLVARWIEHGLAPEAALARAQLNDLPNARTVARDSRAADLIVKAQ